MIAPVFKKSSRALAPIVINVGTYKKWIELFLKLESEEEINTNNKQVVVKSGIKIYCFTQNIK